MRFIIFIFFLIWVFPSTAQKIVKVNGVTGSCEIESKMTPYQAEQNALHEAKKQALIAAGVEERVWSVMGQTISSDNTNFIEAYSEVSSLTLNGLVTVKHKEVQNVWDTTREVQIKMVTIDAEVIKENKVKDPEFRIGVEGIQDSYAASSEFTFNVNIYNKDTYLTVFWFDGKEGSLVFPEQGQEQILMKHNSLVAFPLDNITVYNLKKNDTEAKFEEVHLIVVATKESIPFIGEVNFNSVLKWIYQIPIDRRDMVYNQFLII